MPNLTDTETRTVVKRLYALGGQWDAERSVWILPRERTPDVLELLRELALPAVFAID